MFNAYCNTLENRPPDATHKNISEELIGEKKYVANDFCRAQNRVWNRQPGSFYKQFCALHLSFAPYAKLLRQ